MPKERSLSTPLDHPPAAPTPFVSVFLDKDPSFLSHYHKLVLASPLPLYTQQLTLSPLPTFGFSSPDTMMEDMTVNRYQIPAFGNWDCCDELLISQYFESAMQAGLVRGHYCGEDVDLFKVPAAQMAPAYTQHPRKVKKSASRSGETQHGKEQPRKQGRRVCDVTGGQVPTTPMRRRRRTMAPKAVDEDLYKIPPEFLYQKPKKKSSSWLLGGLLSGCLGLNCVA